MLSLGLYLGDNVMMNRLRFVKVMRTQRLKDRFDAIEGKSKYKVYGDIFI